MNDVREVLGTIEENPGKTWKQIADLLDLPHRRVEDAIWALYAEGKVQMEPDSTLRVTRPGEKVFRYDT